MVIETTRECRRCKVDKDISNFHKHVSGPDGIRTLCKECKKLDNKNKWNLNRNEIARSRYKCPDICVYAFKEGKEISYIGSSDLTPFRLNEHYLGHRSFKDRSRFNRLQFESKFDWVILWHGDSKRDAEHMEKLMIQTHEPKFNKILYKNYHG